MKKIYLLLALCLIAYITPNVSIAQSVLNPNDPVITYNSNTPPTQPAFGQIGKWVRTVRLGWNTDSYKAYIYKGCAFRLKFPKSYNPSANDGKKYPMLVFFHGLGETGSIYDNEYQLYHGGDVFSAAVDNGTFDGYILSMQSQGFWGGNQYQYIAEIIDYMVANNKLDAFRVSDNGLSAGGQATWEMMFNFPTYIAAALPMSAVSIGYKDNSNVNQTKYTPIWLAQGGLDGSPAPPTAQQVRDAYVNAGANFTYTEYPDLGHGVWDRFWTEPNFYPYLLSAYSSNPWPLYGRTEFCSLDSVKVTLGLSPGFAEYQWRKNGVIINGATTNSIYVTDTATYDARVRRGSLWSDWSRTPVRIKIKDATVPPTIFIDNFSSAAIPAPDKNNVVLQVPSKYTSYTWQKVGDATTIGTTSTLNVTQPGSYAVSVKELYGCASVFSAPYKVINANGTNGPDAASSLTAVALSNTKILLEWSNKANPQYNETAFEIYRSTKSGSSYSYIGKSGTDILTFTDSSALPNTTYYYVVRAINNNAAAALSGEANATTLTDNVPPTAPANLHVVSTTSTSVTIAWDSAKDNVGVDKYDVYINGVKTYTTNKLTIVASGLDKGKQYIFYVKAKDLSGNYSTQSNQVSAFAALQGLNYKYYEGSWSALPDFNTLTPVKTGVTTNFDISPMNRDDQFGFVWQGYIKVPVAGTYTFETYSDDGSKLWLSNYDANATPLVNNDGLHGGQFAGGTVTLQPGIYPISAAFFEQGGDQYMQVYWTCSALYGDNNRHLITDDYFTDNYNTPLLTPPVAPTNIAASALDYTRIKVSWTDNSNNETGFEVYRSTNSSGPYQIVKTTAANVTSFTDSALNAATTYYYKVNAINSAGSSMADGLKYSYYSGVWNNLPDFNTLTPSKTGAVKNLDLSVAPTTVNYAMKYEGNIVIPATGQYTFYTTSDDGSKLYVGGFDAAHQVVNNDYLQAPTERSGTVTLNKGVYPIYITFFQQGGGYALSAAYQGPGLSKINIPDSAFSSPYASAVTANLPGAPAVATTVKATAKSSSVIALTWKDNATNETAYKVYRSTDNVTFKFRAVLPVNSVSFNDSSLYAHTTYYYKIYTVGVGDVTSISAVASAKTSNNIPVINDITSRSVRYGITTSILVSAVDSDNDALTYSIVNKPAFATLTSNGNNTATLKLSPTSAQQNVYNNIQIIVNDGNGGKDTTIFALTVSANYDPTFDSIANYTINESDDVTINLNGQDSNASDSLRWTVTNVPNNYSIIPLNNRKAQLRLRPTYAAAGTYVVNVQVSDNNGGFATRSFTLTINDKDPNKIIYARFKDVDVIGAPWNNITGVSTSGLKDANGNATTVGLQMQTNWYATSNGGPSTNNNSGVYPDAVLKDYYYFGIFGGPETVDVKITGLDTALKHTLTFLAASSWPGAADNGTTTFTVGSQTVSQYVQGNTQNTVSISGLKADATGTITFKMAKGNAATPVGYINALVINSVLDDGTVPLIPTSLIANGTGTGVQLNWKDVSYNENNFKIYRSTAQNTGYVLIYTTAANTTSYLDTSARGTTQYYYKLLASNSYGSSDYSNIAGILTANKIPVLNAISNVIIKNNNQLTVQVVANDDATDRVTLTASQLPSFVTFTDNGNGTGSFLIKPSSGTIGFYQGITVTARDNSDSTSTTSFNITVTDNVPSVYLNFSDGSLADKPWNNLTGWPFANTVFSNIKDADNNASGMTVTLVDGFQGVVASGMRPGNNKGIYPDVVMRTGEFEGSTSAKTVRISGLSTSKKYSFIFFASHDDGLKGTTNFTINGQTVTLNASYNINKTVQINGVTPDANGQVNISVAKAAGADYAYLSSLIIQTYDNAVSLINPSSLIVTNNTRSSVSLSWADQSFDETGFEIWRADSSSGSYNLINTVAANTTSYTDNNLTQNRTYYYTVRAIKSGSKSAFSNVAVAYTLAYALYVNFTQDSLAASPWNNTAAPPQKGLVWNNFVDEANNPSGISLTELSSFAGIYGDGNTTGNNSGAVPDKVIAQSYGLFPGQSATMKLSGLNLNMNYDLTFFASSRAYGDVNVAYIVNGKTVLLNASLNTQGTVTMYSVKPDENGEINITCAPGTSTSQFGLMCALIVQAYSNPVLTLPSQMPQSFTNAVTSSAQKLQKNTVTDITKANFDHVVAYPNPFISNFTLNFTLEKKDDVKVEIFDLNGKLMYQYRYVNLSVGKNTVEVTPKISIPSGVYVVKLTSVNSKTNKEIRLLKQQ